MNTFTRSARLCVFVLLCFGLQVSESLSAKEIVAAGRSGDQAPRGPAATAGTEELLTDDSTPEVVVGANNLICVNRLTPTIYPATLQTIRIFFIPLSSFPTPVGAQIKLIAFAGAQGTTQPPSNPTLLVNQTVTIPSLPASGAFIDFPIQNGPTINGGDIYVGFQAPNPMGGVLFAGDRTGQAQQRAFFSTNDGQMFQGPLTVQGGEPVNLMMRAIVTNNAAAAPRIDAPTVLSLGYANPGMTSEGMLTVRNAGDAQLNITGVTSNDPQFTAASLTLPLTIAPGAQSAITLRFAPASPGAQNAMLTIASNDSTRPSVNVGLSGIGGQAPTARTLFANAGAAQTGSIPGPPPGAGVINLTQYAVFVPSGATQLKIDLSGNQNLDLFVRFNQPITLSGGSLQADYGSTNPGVAPESISITPSTTPPLQAGLYYIAIGNFGPGAANFTLTATITGGTAPGAAATVSAASFAGPDLASAAIVAGFGSGLATSTQVANSQPLPTNLAGTTIKIRDNAGTERLAPLFFVSPTQANFQITPGTVNGAAFLTFTGGDGKTSTGTAQIVSVTPGLFAANADAQGVPAALALRARADGSQSTEPVARFDSTLNRFVPAPIDLGPVGDQVFLVAFGTGIRGRSSLSAVTATIGGVPVMVAFAGEAPGFVGLDQANLLIPRSLVGRGDVDLVFMVDGKTANTLKLNIK